jgi:putative membrane protein
MFKSMLAGMVVFGLAAAPAFAAGQEPTTGTKTTKTTAHKTAAGGDADHMFVMKVAKGGMAEVQLGQLASEKASSDEVKKFGQRMVTDHNKANDELKSLAQQKNITLPTEIDAKDKALHDRLAKLSGPAFDRAYMQHMITDHRAVVTEFKKESTMAKDPDIKAWAAKTLPTIEEHLKLAQDANHAVGTSGTLKK